MSLKQIHPLGKESDFARSLKTYERLDREGQDKARSPLERGRSFQSAAEVAESAGLGSVRSVYAARRSAEVYVEGKHYKEAANVIEKFIIAKLGLAGIGSDTKALYISVKEALSTSSLASSLAAIPRLAPE